jgi:hypothetical protein
MADIYPQQSEHHFQVPSILTPLKTDLSPRAPSMDCTPSPYQDERLSTEPPTLRPKRSRRGLRNMFSRTRLNKDISDMRSPTILEVPSDTLDENLMDFNPPPSATLSTFSSDVRSPPSLSHKASRLSLMPKALRSSVSLASISMTGTSKFSRRTTPAWSPPPLYLVFPLAVKYADLPASALLADTTNQSIRKRSTNLVGVASKIVAEVDEAIGKTTESVRRKRRRQPSDALPAGDATRNIFVLTSTRQLLQYAGDGESDRLPEKVLELGQESVVFVSDAIPGRHYVLQVSQAMDADGTVTADSKSLFSKLTSNHRRHTTSLLLVFDGVEEMESWLAAIRREIEFLGGRKRASETDTPAVEVDSPEEEPRDPEPLVNASPRRFSRRSLQNRHSVDSAWNHVPEMELSRGWNEGADSVHRPNSFVRPSTDTWSSVASHETPLTNITRESSHRHSYMSSGQQTLMTSGTSSPANSPTRESCGDGEEHAIAPENARPNAFAISERRRSMQTMQHLTLDLTAASKSSRPQSTIVTSRNATASPTPAPNFSLPQSSKRFSTGKAAPPPQSAPSAPAVAKSSASLRRTRPLGLALARPLSPVQDEPSPQRTLHQSHASISSFEEPSQPSPEMAEPPCRPKTSCSNHRSPVSPTVNGFLPVNPLFPDDFRFPVDRVTGQPSLQSLRDEIRAEDSAPLLFKHPQGPISPRSTPLLSQQQQLSPAFVQQSKSTTPPSPNLSDAAEADNISRKADIAEITSTPPAPPPCKPLPSPPSSSCSSTMNVLTSSATGGRKGREGRRGSAQKGVSSSGGSRPGSRAGAISPTPSFSTGGRTRGSLGSPGIGIGIIPIPVEMVGPPSAPPPERALPALPGEGKLSMEDKPTNRGNDNGEMSDKK